MTALLQTAYDALAEAIANGAKAPLRDRLQELIADTEVLLAKVVTGTLEYQSGLDPEGVTLQTTDAAAPYYLSTNAQEPSEGPITNLLDGNTGTFFHSTWSGTQPDGNHYLQIDMGEDDDIGIFSFGFTNRQHASNTAENGKHSPTEILVKGSADGSSFTEITTLTTADGLPTATGTVSTFASGNIGNPSPRYRYLRLEVTATNTSQRFFTLSEFNFARARARSLEAVKAEGFDGVSDDAIIFGAYYKDEAKSLVTEPQYTTATMAQLALRRDDLQAAYDTLLREMFAEGDINLDGKVNITDVATLIAILRGRYAEAHGATDLNSDRQTDEQDVEVLERLILGE